jgi:hypothetical protein
MVANMAAIKGAQYSVAYLGSMDTTTTTSASFTPTKTDVTRCIVAVQGFNAGAENLPTLPVATFNGTSGSQINAQTSNSYDDTASFTVSYRSVPYGKTVSVGVSATTARSFMHVYEVYGFRNLSTAVTDTQNVFITASTNSPLPTDTVTLTTSLKSFAFYANMANLGAQITSDTTGKLNVYSLAGISTCYFLSGFDTNPTSPTTTLGGGNTGGVIISNTLSWN